MKKRNYLLAIGMLLIAGSSLVLFSGTIANYVVIHHKSVITAKQIAKNEKKIGQYDWQSVDTLDAKTILSSELSSDKLSYLGLVYIPDIDLKLPILNGTTNATLALGAGTMYAGQRMGEGNYSLASHFVQGNQNKKLLFSPIYYKGKVGQKIYLTDLKKLYVYTTSTYAVVSSKAVEVVKPVAGKRLVTLITCNYTHDHGRVVMQGKLTDVIKWRNAPASVKQEMSEMIR